MLFDSHLHIVDPRFPLVGDFRPAPFTVADYRRATAGLGIAGGAVVAASFQGLDPAYLVDALARLGRGFVGVAQLPAGTPDEDIRALDRAGVRAVRFTVRRGVALDDELAHRVNELAGWHAEVYTDDVGALEERLAALPRIVIDHLGLREDALPALLRLVERGAKVKASGFGRFAGDVRAMLRAIDPGALMFGTDLPSTRAPRPFRPADIDLVREAAGERALAANAQAWYLKKP